MPTFELSGPDGGTYHVDAPDETAALDAFHSMSGSAPPTDSGSSLSGVAKSLGTGLAQGAIGLAGIPADLAHLYAPNSSDPNPLGAEGLQKKVEQYTGDFYKPQGTAEDIASKIGQFAPAMIGGPETLAAKAATRVVAPAVASEAAGKLTEGTAAQPYAEVAGALAGGAGASAAATKFKAMMAARAAEAAAPSALETKAASRLLYQHPDVAAVQIRPESMSALADKIDADLQHGTNSGFRPANEPKVFSAVDELRTPAKDQPSHLPANTETPVPTNLEPPATIPEKTQLPEYIRSGPAHAKTTPLSGKSLFHETSAENAAGMLTDDLTNSTDRIRSSNIFVADNPDIAIGQGGSGIRIEYNGDLVSGAEHKKPGTGDLSGREYRTNAIGNNAIKSILVGPGEKLPLRPAWQERFDGTFDRATQSDGSTLYTRKKPDIQPAAARPTVQTAYNGATQPLTGGRPAKIADLDNVRQVLGGLAKEKDAIGQPTRQAAAAARAMDHINDFLPNLKQPDLLAGDAAKANDILNKARGNWAAFKKSSTVQTTLANAQLNAASANSGGNIQNSIKQGFKPLLKNNGAKTASWSPDEKAALNQIVRGTWTGSAARAAGNLLGGGGGLGMLIGGAAGYEEGGIPGMVATGLAGRGLKMIGNASTMNAVKRLDSLIRSRSPEALRLAAQTPQIAQKLPSKSIRMLRTMILAEPALSQGQQQQREPVS